MVIKPKLYRTIVRIVSVNEKLIEIVVPGWNPHMTISIKSDSIPNEIRKTFKPGTRLFARVNTGAEEAKDLCFEQFELAPDLDDFDL